MKLSFGGLPEEDLSFVITEFEKISETYANREILIYGGTGFIGTWLTSSLLFASQKLNLNCKIKIITRNAHAAKIKFGYESSNLQIYQHDLSKSAPIQEISADFIFHAATPSNKSTGSENSHDLLSATVNAALHAITVKSNNLPVPFVVHLNSGAIYGIQTTVLRSENDQVLKSSSNSYVQAKIQCDDILFRAKAEELINLHSPRLFAFGGPLLMLKEHFAIGNFIWDGMQNKKIEVKGNPQTTRSYMYPGDLVSILLKLPTQKSDLPINIGSETVLSMTELATTISELTSRKGVYFTNPNAEANHYVPSTTNLEMLLGHSNLHSTDELLEKWIKWIKFTTT
jgi:dTDP-glucose 4,6-dehydratase